MVLQKIKKKNSFGGAGAKGVTFVNLFDQLQKHITSLIDINPDKQGRYVGITAHKVFSPEEVFALYNEGTIIVLNPNYLTEIKRYITNLAPNNKMQLYMIA